VCQAGCAAPYEGKTITGYKQNSRTIHAAIPCPAADYVWRIGSVAKVDDGRHVIDLGHEGTVTIATPSEVGGTHRTGSGQAARVAAPA
jgi:hypothetical protein